MFFDIAKQPDKPSIKAFELTPTPGSKDAPVPVDDFELVVTEKPYQVMTDEELMSLTGTTLLVDVECFENYFLVGFQSFVNGHIIQLEEFEDTKLDRRKLLWIMENFTTVGFMSNDYDIPMIRIALQGYGSAFLKSVSNEIILYGRRSFELEKKFNLVKHKWNHVDLAWVAPLQGSLKLYAGRLHCKRMQDLPIEHTAILTFDEKESIRKYNCNDLDNTGLLLHELGPQLDLRAKMSAQFGIDVRSRSDAQIAEYVIISELEKINGSKPKRPEIPPGKIYYYTPPPCVKYETQQFKDMLEVVRKAKLIVGEDGSIPLPEEIAKLNLKMGSCTYRMGIGGLHSSEKCVAHIADENTLLIDRDVASYYPSITLNNKLAPKHLGNAFLVVYKGLVDRRLEAKRTKDTVSADSLKITINGTFGKTGNKWSVIYSPDLLLQITITGQLCLLLLIEMLELAGIPIISANTDGVLIKCPKSLKAKCDKVIALWEQRTGFVTEEGTYLAVYTRDVNNYIALPTDTTKKPKVKGAYAEKGSGGNTVLSKNPENLVCNDAVISFLSDGVAIEHTVRNCRDIRRFVTVRNVKGGAIKSGVYLGKTIRWYYSTAMQGQIEYKTPNKQGNHNKVPNSDRAMPLMELPETLPADLDFDRYIEVAKAILVDVGC